MSMKISQIVCICFLLFKQSICAKNYYYLPLYGNDSFGSYYAIIYLGNPPQPQALAIDTGSSQLFVLCKECVGCNILSILPQYDPKISLTSSYVNCVPVQLFQKDKKFKCKIECKSAVDICQQQIIYEDMTAFTGEVIRDQIRFETQQDSQSYITQFNGIKVYQHTFYTMKENGIMGLSMFNSGSILSKWFKSRSSKYHIFSVCMGQQDGFFQIGDVKRSNNQNNTFVQLGTNYFYGVNDFESLYFGQIDLTANITDKIEIIIDTGTTRNHLPFYLLSTLVQKINQICDKTKKCIQKLKGVSQKNKKHYYCYTLMISHQQKLSDVFPTIKFVLKTGSIIYMDPQSYFYLNSSMFSQKDKQKPEDNSYCLAIDQSSFVLLGIAWLKNKKVIFDLSKGIIQIEYNHSCQYIKLQKENDDNFFIFTQYIPEILIAVFVIFLLFSCKKIKQRLLFLKFYLFNKDSNKQEVPLQLPQTKQFQEIGSNNVSLSIQNQNMNLSSKLQPQDKFNQREQPKKQ